MSLPSEVKSSIAQKQRPRLWLCVAIIAGLLATGTASFASQDTARFSGTWKMEFSYSGQTVTVVSVHDNRGYTNYVLYSGHRWPAGDGTFNAANGKYSTSAAKPNNAGSYRFIDDNTVDCTNAAGQTATWKRYNTPLPPIIENGGYNLRVKPSLNLVLEAARKNLKDLVFTYIEIQGVPGYLWFQYDLYSPSTGAIVSGWAGGPNDGKYDVSNWKPHDPAQTPLPIDFKVDFADAMEKLQKTGLKPTGLGITRLVWAGATGKTPMLAWSIRVGGTNDFVPLFVNAQTDQLIPWQQAMDPVTGNDAQIQAWRDSFKTQASSGQGQANSGLSPSDMVYLIQQGTY